MKPSGTQLDEPDRPAGLRHPHELGRGARLVGGEHRPEDREGGVERLVGERDLLGVAFTEIDADPLGSGALAAALEQGGDVVDAGHDAAEPGGGDRRVAAPARDVEHGRAGAQVRGVGQALGDGDDQGGDLGEVAARPRRLLTGLDGCQIERWCGGHGILAFL